MTRIKSSMHDSNILDNTYIINMISENMIMKLSGTTIRDTLIEVLRSL